MVSQELPLLLFVGLPRATTRFRRRFVETSQPRCRFSYFAFAHAAHHPQSFPLSAFQFHVGTPRFLSPRSVVEYGSLDSPMCLPGLQTSAPE